MYFESPIIIPPVAVIRLEAVKDVVAIGTVNVASEESISNLSTPPVEKLSISAPLDHIPVLVSPEKWKEGVPTAPKDPRKSEPETMPLPVIEPAPVMLLL